jgi:mannitol-1-phosphate/altronate dehydrogenase
MANVDPAQREKLETLNGVHSNAAGFRRWLETRHDHSHPHP